MLTFKKYIAFVSLSLNIIFLGVWIYAFNRHANHEDRVATYKSIFMGLDSTVTSVIAIILTISSFAYFFFGPESLSRKALGIIQIVFLFWLLWQYM